MDKNKVVFGKLNYILMIAGILILMTGFYVMSLDKEEYGFGDLGLTTGPIIVLIGFTVEFFAIFIKSKDKAE
jgi:uncharacterized membrane protein